MNEKMLLSAAFAVSTAAAMLLTGCSSVPMSTPSSAPLMTDMDPTKSSNPSLGLEGDCSDVVTGPAVVDASTLPSNQPGAGGAVQMRAPKRPEMPVSPEEAARQRAEAMNLLPNDLVNDPTTRGGTDLMPGAVSFESIDASECCSPGLSVPPDPELGVGPNHIIAVVNTSLEIYDKAGNSLVGPTDGDVFFANLAGCGGLFDPNVNYDEEEDRWFMGWDDGDAYCIAVTQTPDATGNWNLYRVPALVAPGTTLFDYPHAGVGEDAIYMGSNQFGGGFIEGRVWAFNKDEMYAGAANPGCQTHSTGADSTPWPADLHGLPFPTGPQYIITEVYDGANHSVWEWDDPFGADILTKTGNVNLSAVSGAVGQAINWPQMGGDDLQANDWRTQSTHYRDGRLWMSNQTVSCNPGAGTVDCIRWAEIDPNGAGPSLPSVVQSEVIGSDGEYRTFGSLAVDACGNMALGYSKGSATTFPGTWVTGRLAGDAPGTTQAEQLMKAGEATYVSFEGGGPRRWGDYTGMTIDPDGKTFWYLGEYAKAGVPGSTNWAMYIGSYTFDCQNDNIFDTDFESGDCSAWAQNPSGC